MVCVLMCVALFFVMVRGFLRGGCLLGDCRHRMHDLFVARKDVDFIHPIHVGGSMLNAAAAAAAAAVHGH